MKNNLQTFYITILKPAINKLIEFVQENLLNIFIVISTLLLFVMFYECYSLALKIMAENAQLQEQIQVLKGSADQLHDLIKNMEQKNLELAQQLKKKEAKSFFSFFYDTLTYYNFYEKK